MSTKLTIIMPTDEEEAAINAGIAADPDTYELSDEEFAQLRPFQEGPYPYPPRVMLKLDDDVADAFQAEGATWERHANTILREWLVNHGMVSHTR